MGRARAPLPFPGTRFQDPVCQVPDYLLIHMLHHGGIFLRRGGTVARCEEMAQRRIELQEGPVSMRQPLFPEAEIFLSALVVPTPLQNEDRCKCLLFCIFRSKLCIQIRNSICNKV